jgi:acyl carrier protein
MSDDRLIRAVAAGLKLPPERIGEDTSRENCDGWDSLRHYSVILEVERVFGVRFPSPALPELTSVLRLRQELTRLAPPGQEPDRVPQDVPPREQP